MPTLPAARLADIGICPIHGETAISASADTVKVNSRPQTRIADACMCAVGNSDSGQPQPGVPGQITTGSGTVKVNGLFAARSGLSKTDHNGLLLMNGSNVFIGGPDVTVVGNAAAAIAACKAAAATRHTPGSAKQAYGNCCAECWRPAINQLRAAQGLPPLTEDEMVQRAIASGAYSDPSRRNYGGFGPGGMDRMLADNGLPDYGVPQTPQALSEALAEGHAVSVTVDPGAYSTPDGSNELHEVLVAGVVQDADGNVIGYLINDSGLGVCGKFVDAAKFEHGLKPGVQAAVSKAKVW